MTGASASLLRKNTSAYLRCCDGAVVVCMGFPSATGAITVGAVNRPRQVGRTFPEDRINMKSKLFGGLIAAAIACVAATAASAWAILHWGGLV